MKKIILSALFMTFSLSTMSAELPKACAKNAVKAVAAAAETQYDKNGIQTLECKVTANKAATICDVIALKGDGAANDSFVVVLNKACNKILRVELTGEE